MRALLLLACVAIGSVPMACGSPTASDHQPFALSLTGPEAGIGAWVQSEGFTFLGCGVPLTATAKGDGYADWTSGEKITDDPEFGPIHNDLSAADLVDAWGSSRIQGGAEEEAIFNVYGTDSFHVTIRLRYTLDSGETRTSERAFTCTAPTP